ncbi:toxin-antitoxin system HicB family antitoxin [Engelhardtia mirabilis]|uniref:Uncharacterized protein n=1 Tax=Engelhardtia mirabilis TaxID=2528011 RepID=A0A518BF04_9BACT|nr:hypothetical protein Pla133_06330 [Planctomycetes bacterium Pla133]QDU99893.1 hypothetical protein Pla86_06320 [Planctomycetes bacterium Pla86]
MADRPDSKQDRKAFLLRLPPKLHAELRRWANTELRSLNGQIEFLLRDAVERRRGRGDGAPADEAESEEDPEV